MQKPSFDDLAGKVCILTGGAGVIGSTLVKGLASAGVRTAILDLNQDLAVQVAEQTERESSIETIGVGADVLDRDSLLQYNARGGRYNLGELLYLQTRRGYIP